MSLRVVVADDEPLGRRGITARLAGRAGVVVVAECADGEEAVEAVRREEPDLLYLDVRMPGLGGFAALEALAPEKRPLVIFVTAHEEHALRAFAFHAVDYLVKPIDDERFEEAFRLVQETITRRRESEIARRVATLVSTETGPPATAKSRPATDRFPVKLKGRTLLLRHAEIERIEAEGDYVRIHAAGKSYLVRDTMSAVERALPPRRFLRIHRSAIVNVDRVAEVRRDDGGDGEILLRDGTAIRWSRGYREAVERLLRGA
jgi:two-component system LytT family response regulator